MQVFAEDRDAIDGEGGPNGQIEYSIVSQHNKFTIDPETGWLSTSAVRQNKTTDKTNSIQFKPVTENGYLDNLITLYAIAITWLD